jgi:sphingolipid delta-4 desaturase
MIDASRARPHGPSIRFRRWLPDKYDSEEEAMSSEHPESSPASNHDELPLAGRGSPEQLANFIIANYPEPHRSRSLDMLRRHPEVRRLFGRNPWTALYIFSIVALQVALAFFLQNAAWWLILLAGWTVGALASHLTFCLYHECTHHLVFPRKAENHLLGLFANLPLLVPSYASFSVYHLKHHQYQGDYELDADMATAWEARLIGHSMAGKILWELFFPFFQAFRTIRFSRNSRIPFVTGWLVANIAAQVLFVAALLAFWKPGAFLYLLASLFFALGFHPVGARWIAEHFVLQGAQETYSYYGPMNRIAVNIGYHNEHHDFPFVPWNRLPALKAMAPEVYDALNSHRSWLRVWYRFLTDRDISLFSRVARDGLLNRARQAMPKELYAPNTFDENAEGAV